MRAVRAVLCVLAVVILANAVFFALQYAAAGRPDIAAARTRAAFAVGDLTTNDWPRFDSKLGANQYSDCMVLQMISTPAGSRLERAVAPTSYARPGWQNICATLRAVVSGSTPMASYDAFKYSRYWHGYNVVTAVALRLMDLGTMRRMLTGAVWLGIVALALVTWFGGPYTRIVGACIVFTAATVWAVPYYAPSIAHGVGDAALLFWLAGIVLLLRVAPSTAMLTGVAAAFGASVVFFEFLVGQLPIAAGWLMALTIAGARDQRDVGADAHPVRASLAAVTVFGIGAVMSIACKQVLAALTVHGTALSDFGGKLSQYSQRPAEIGGGLLIPVRALWRMALTLTYGNLRLGQLLIAGAVVLWIVGLLGAVAAVRQCAKPPTRSCELSREALVILAAALIPGVWTMLLPTHTTIHAWFMVRILIVTISLAPVALWWCVTSVPAWSTQLQRIGVRGQSVIHPDRMRPGR